MIAQVIINSNVKDLNKIFDYNVPNDMLGTICVGDRILVPFGRGEKFEEGFVIGFKDSSEFKVKDIAKIQDGIKLTKENIELVKLMARRYFCNISDCIKLMLPPGTATKNIDNRIKDKTLNFVYLKKEIEEIEDDSDEDDIPDSLETELEEPEEHFKDINEKVVTYLYRGFKELGDNVRVYLDDEENEERDPNLIDSLNEFMEGYSEVMDFIQNFAKDYVSDLELIGLENDAEANPDDMEEIPDEEVEEEDLEAEDLEVVESYIKENNLDHNVFENEYEIYARYSSDAEARKYEENLKKFKSAEVFRHEDIGEVHAYIRVKKG